MTNIIVIDLETDGLDFLKPELVGYATLRPSPNGKSMTWSGITNTIGDVVASWLQDPNYLKVCHSLMFEYNYLKSLGVTMSPPFYCTQIASQLCNMSVEEVNPSTKKIRYSYSLKKLAEKYLGYGDLTTFKQLAKQYQKLVPTGEKLKSGKDKMKKVDALSSDIPEEVLSRYCKQDVEMTYKLFELTYKKLKANPMLWNLFTKIKMPLIPVYCSMQRTGIKIDKVHLTEQAGLLNEQIKKLEVEMNELIKNNP